MAVGENRSCVVAGGGIVGAACALRLQAAGFAVTLVDPGDPRRGAAFGNAGHIGTEQVTPLASWGTLRSAPGQLFGVGGALDFRWRDAPLWGPWGVRLVGAAQPARFARGTEAMTALLAPVLGTWERLLTLAGAPGLVRPNGHLVVWMREAAAARSLARWRRTPTGTAAFRELTLEELSQLGAHLRAVPAGGIRFQGTGQVAEPQAVRTALLAAFTARGGKTETGSVRSLAVRSDGVTAALAGGQSIAADRALVTAGAWSGPLMQSLAVRTPILGERGYSVQSAEHSWPADLPPILFEERMVVVTRFTSGLRATSFTELGNPSAPPDPRKWQRLERHLAELGIAFANSPDRWMGPRPTLPDFLPAIGRLERAPRVLYAFGHQHLGLTLAAVTAELIEALACERAPAIDLAPFRVERFV